MTPFEAYTGCIPSLDSLITFGTKITAKKPGDRPTTLNPWTYDGIFLGYQNTKNNIRYWDVHTGTTKTATHDSKDELQYGDSPANRSPASEHLMEVFTGDSSTTTNTTPDKIELKLKDVKSPTSDEIQKQIIDESPKAYTAAAAAKLTHKPRRRIVRKLRGIINKIRKNAFKRPDLTHLKQELESIDLSTNTFV